MARLFEICNGIDSAQLLAEGEALTEEEADRLKQGIKGSLKAERRRRAGIRAAWIAAAAVFAIIVIPNTSKEAACAMSRIPVLGTVIKTVTLRKYEYRSERFEADIDEKILESDAPFAAESEKVQGSAVPGQQGAQQDPVLTEKTGESVKRINESIEEMTERLIAQFEEQVALGESYGGVYTDTEVVTDTDTWFTLRITVTEVVGSGSQYQYFYHIDKTTGEIAGLRDLFADGADYVTPISESIIRQMRENMAADENLIYWVDQEDVPEWNFTQIKEDQNFYLNEDGEIVICFDEYEAAPGYMGLLQFTIEKEAVQDILKQRPPQP